MEYIIDDREMCVQEFLSLACSVWPGDYDAAAAERATARTLNITARENGCLIGCLRILTDGCFFGTITELLVRPEYQGRGVGSRLLRLAAEHTPTMLYFSAQPGVEGFYEKNDLKKSLQSYMIEKPGT